MTPRSVPALVYSTKARKTFQSTHGFTMLELVIVIVLIGIILSMSVPSMRIGLFNEPLERSARKLIALLSETRDRAVREQQPFLIIADLDEKVLWYVSAKERGDDTIPEKPEKGLLELESGVDFHSIWLKSKGEKARGIQELWVSKQGYMDETVIRLEEDNGDTLSLHVSTFLPKVELQEGLYEVE